MCAQIFSTNDTHGHLLPAEQSWSEGRPVGGSAALAGYLAEVRAADADCPVFVVSAGDIMQGTLISNLTDGRSTIDVFNAIGYDVAAIGNHEFDWGVDVLVDRVGQARFPLLGANIYLKGTDRHPDWVRPWAVVEKDGVRIGFVGMTTITTPTVTRPSNVVDFEFRPISETLDRYVPLLRQQGVDFVVAVMHAGGYCDQGGCRGEAIEELAAVRAPFDYAVTGHTHSRIETRIDGAPVVQSHSYSTAYGLGRLQRSPTGQVRSELYGVNRTYADQVTPDSRVAAVVAQYEVEMAGLVGQVVMRLPEPLEAPRRGDFALGRLIADAQRFDTGAQIALMNNGGIRRPLPAGEVTYSDLFELQPFGNTLIRLTLSGEHLLDALELSAADDGIDLQVSGLTVRYDPGAATGSRILRAVLDDGAPVTPEDRYVVTVNDFIAAGGGGYTMFLEADAVVQTGVVDLEALVRYVGSRPQPVQAPAAPRWIQAPPR